VRRAVETPLYGAAYEMQHHSMQAEVIRVDPVRPESGAISRAAAVLRAGGLVAFPTETVYGLGANALDASAVARIFAAKGRPAYNPLIVHVPDAGAAQVLVSAWPELAARAAAAFWPGPLTLVLPRRPAVPDAVTAGLPTVGVRVPAHPVAGALLRAAGVPVAAPSANLFTRVSPTTAQHVIAGLGDRADLILDGGATPYGIESTVLDLTGTRPRILRHGAIPADELAALLGPVDEVTVPESTGDDSRPRPAPGMTGRHYAPAARLVVFAGVAEAQRHAGAARARGEKAGAIVRGAAGVEADHVIPLPDEPAGYARLFYASLHTLDEAGCGVILVEAVPATAAWRAVRDRLSRAG
jgi:L-threonylcarbamoyladenylate synthase